jgi:multicomponent Na+:H+ antiporter subunit E
MLYTTQLGFITDRELQLLSYQQQTAFRGQNLLIAYVVSLLLMLAGVWLMWSGIFTTQLLILGLLSVLVVTLIAFRMHSIDRESMPVEMILPALVYAPWLFWEIAKANLEVMIIILTPSLPISPSVVTIEGSQKTDLGLAIHGNSITLTPGTVTLDIDDCELTVHALTTSAEASLKAGGIDRRVRGLEKWLS